MNLEIIMALKEICLTDVEIATVNAVILIFSVLLSLLTMQNHFYIVSSNHFEKTKSQIAYL